MPARTLPAPLLSLATTGLNGLTSVDADNLSCMWTGIKNNPHFFPYIRTVLTISLVFTKCAENLENGRRLENFSWRLWYREAHFFEDPSLPPSKPISFDRNSAPQPIPSPPEVLSDLSESVTSASDLEDAGHVVDQPQPESHAASQPGLARQEYSSRRQSVKHLSPDSFKCLIESLEPPTAEAEKWKALKAKKESDENSAAEALANAAASETRVPEPPRSAPAMPTDIPARARTMSDSQGSPSAMSGRSLQRVSSSIVRGFTPENPSISRRLTPIEPPAPVAHNVPEVRKKPKFFIASSVSDSDDEYTPLSLKSSIKPASKSTISPPGMKRASSNGSSTKKTHFHEIVHTKILSAPQTEEESDGDEEDSAVMSDDEDDDWEDSQSDNGEAQDEHLFDKREDTHLTSRHSMLSTLFKSKSDYNLPSQAFRASNTFVRSRTSPSHTPRPQPFSPPGDGPALRIPAQVSGLAGADQFTQPIPASPRTTRRKMLASELSESLRRNLLWERQHRTMTNNAAAAALKRRHTSNDLARLKEYPEGLSGRDTSPAESGKDVFDSGDAVW